MCVGGVGRKEQDGESSRGSGLEIHYTYQVISWKAILMHKNKQMT